MNSRTVIAPATDVSTEKPMPPGSGASTDRLSNGLAFVSVITAESSVGESGSVIAMPLPATAIAVAFSV